MNSKNPFWESGSEHVFDSSLSQPKYVAHTEAEFTIPERTSSDCTGLHATCTVNDLDQKTLWEQNVSLCVNELGVSSYPDTGGGGDDRKTIHNKICYLPICMEISPMAQVALLHTEINSGFRLSPRMGMNSAGEEKWTPVTTMIHKHTAGYSFQPPIFYSSSLKTWAHEWLQQSLNLGVPW